MTASTKPIRPVARLEVEAAGVMVDEVLDERLGLGDGRLPGGRVLAHDLVGVLAGGQPRDADVLELDARVVALELADEPGQGGHAERARLLAGRVDVVGQHDAARRSGSGARPGPGSGPCPRLATTFSKPAWWAISASV